MSAKKKRSEKRKLIVTASMTEEDVVGWFDKLEALISRYADAKSADEMKGGGDPDAYELIEAELELARVKLEYHIARMRRELVP